MLRHAESLLTPVFQTTNYPCVRGMLWRLLFSTSSMSTAAGEIRKTRYRRLTMSPSEAMKMSSPDDRKIFFGSPVLLAKPKNFRLMGGGGGMGGGPNGPG